MPNDAALPPDACAYGRYDAETLEPLNESTALRIAELGWSAADFQGRSVLDIGMNTGLLSIQACRLGASEVHSTDVSQTGVDFFSRVVAEKKLSVTVERRAFSDLGDDDRADVVLFMEVIHWTTSQGIPIPDAIRRLVNLTRETLYFEFPWSVDEPSIKVQTSLTHETYNADMILDHLTRYFADVRVVSFMHYFGHSSPSRRALLRASKRRPQAELLTQLPDSSALDCATWGRNGIAIASTTNGLRALKAVPAEKCLNALPDVLFDALMESLSHASVVVPALKLPDGYSVRSQSGTRLMAFPWVQSGRRIELAYWPLSAADAVRVAVGLRGDLAAADPLAPRLREHGFSVTVLSAAAKMPANMALAGLSASGVGAHTLTETDLDCVSHLDLQAANVVRGAKGEMRVVDLDNLGLATAYTDGLLGIVWAGGGAGDIAALETALAPTAKRGLETRDILAALAIAFQWHATARAISASITERARAQFTAGVEALIARIGTA